MRFRSLLYLLLLGLMWGPSFMFIKVAVGEISPTSLAAVRIGLAAVILWALLKVRRASLPRSWKTWTHLLVMGFFANSLPFTLFNYSELTIDSATAGIINGATPIAAVVLAHFFVSNERFCLSRFTGVVLGLAGFLTMLIPQLLLAPETQTPDSMGTSWGILCAGAAALSYAIGMIYGRKYLSDLPPMVAPAGQLLSSAVYMLPLAFLLPGPSPLALHSLPVIGAVVALAAWGTVGAFTIYYRVLKRNGATYLSMATYLLPVFSTILGVIFLHEHLRWNTYLAGGLILLGMMTVNGTVNWGRFIGRRRSNRKGQLVQQEVSENNTPVHPSQAEGVDHDDSRHK